MEKNGSARDTACKLCKERFKLPENEDEGNLPRILACGHIYCTNCLLSIQSDNVIRCPGCQEESTLPAGGVFGLQEESSIIGVIYTAKINESYRRKNKLQESQENKMKEDETEKQAGDTAKADTIVGEALAEAAGNLSQLISVHEALTDGLTELLEAEKARLQMEISQAADKALCAIQKWKTVQLHELTELETQFFSSQQTVSHIQERIKSLKNAMQMAREIRRVPFLDQYCVLDKLLETLRAPVDSFDLKRISLGSSMSCVFQEENLDQSLSLSLKMEKRSLKLCGAVEGGCSGTKLPNFQEQDQENLRSQSITPSPKPSDIIDFSSLSSCSDLQSPDVIVEEVLEEEVEELVDPVTGPDRMSKKLRHQSKKRRHQSFKKQHDSKWVVVSHIVSPAHFYVRHVADKLESEVLSKRIHNLCSGNGCSFALGDSLESKSLVFVLSKERQWCRSRVVEILQQGNLEAVKICPVTQLAGVYVYSLDFGFCRRINIQSEDGTPESTLKAVNNQLRKICEDVKLELSGFVPQAIRCSLKDLVPYDLGKGWDNRALVAFRAITGSAALEMQPLGRDRDALLVDLRKIPVEQHSDVPISLREYLVFNEVARFYYPVITDRKPLLYYPPVYPRVNTELNVVVCHINSPGDFYVQAVDSMESLLLTTRLQDCYNTPAVLEDEELKVYCPEIGQPCVARFEENLWYRAQVIGCPRASKVEVLYVDFGNRKIIPVSDLRKIKNEFFTLPAMAIPCCLADVIPFDGETWSEVCTSRFISLTYQKLVLIFVTERVSRPAPIPVTVFESDGAQANIAEVLVKEELACCKDKMKTNKASLFDNDADIWDPVLEISSAKPSSYPSGKTDCREQNKELLDLQIHLRSPDQLKDLTVRISHVCSPSSFYVQFTQYDAQLQRICEKVRSECELTEPQEVVWKADMFCAAYINGVWERGQICADLTSTDTAEVRRCDHGNTEKLHVSSLRPLPSSLIGSMSLECSLDDITPTGGQSVWTSTAIDLFSHYVSGAVALITIKEPTEERPVPVTLFCSNKIGQYVSMSDFLVHEGLALGKRKPRDPIIQKPEEKDVRSPTTKTQTNEKKNSSLSLLLKTSLEGTLTPPKPSPRRLNSTAKVKTSLYNAPQLPSPGHIQMTVTAVGDDGVIYGRSQDLECQLQQLCLRIQQTWKTLPEPKPYTWKSVLGCAVFGSDSLWYRGQILSVLGGNVEVQYVDHGFVENIPMAHVYPVLLCADVPQLCIPCKLHGINPLGGRWQEFTVAFLRELLQNRFVDVQILDLPADPRGPLTVQIFLDGLNLNEILSHHGHGSVDAAIAAEEEHTAIPPTPILDVWDITTEGLVETQEPMLGPFVSPNLPQEGDHFKVQVKHLCTPNEVFLWPLEGAVDTEVEGETLEEALFRINANISTLPPLTCFNSGYPCLAEYSDGKYYRAKLLQITSLEPVTLLVQHVDFGSDDALPPRKLRQMPADLLKFPTQVLKVRIAGLKAPTISQQKDVLPYSPGWSVAAAMEMIDLLHGSITATVVAREPDVVVQLYNKDGELVHLGLVNKGLAELE
ncbi:RING finger protein 17 isoform X2 [Oryzias latipes]|uniref:RING finger protein 17 isoform X2 n=1 Tax=Oryzias latipes TaxID=8090 RepID=UPI000CE24C1A|nr:RING finger protein 17 isoform X2 [Oryzias latipes]